MKPTIGQTYFVEWDDCCVEGEFTSELVEIVSWEDEDYCTFRFANGVTCGRTASMNLSLTIPGEVEQE